MSKIEVMNWSGCEIVEIVPDRVSGVPLLKGTRVPIDQILASIDGGESVEEVAYNFDLNPADIQSLLSYRERNRAA